MAFSFKQRRKIPCAGATVNISLLC
ncbi:glyceraldehyde-3-phosphate dehydrogenase, partial [Enterobacter cloacae]